MVDWVGSRKMVTTGWEMIKHFFILILRNKRQSVQATMKCKKMQDI